MGRNFKKGKKERKKEKKNENRVHIITCRHVLLALNFSVTIWIMRIMCTLYIYKYIYIYLHISMYLALMIGHAKKKKNNNVSRVTCRPEVSSKWRFERKVGNAVENNLFVWSHWNTCTVESKIFESFLIFFFLSISLSPSLALYLSLFVSLILFLFPLARSPKFSLSSIRLKFFRILSRIFVFCSFLRYFVDGGIFNNWLFIYISI